MYVIYYTKLIFKLLCPYILHFYLFNYGQPKFGKLFWHDFHYMTNERSVLIFCKGYSRAGSLNPLVMPLPMTGSMILTK